MKQQRHQEMEAMFAYLCQQHHDTGIPPTLREIADAFFMSPGSVMRYLDKMEAQGWITREWRKARGITLLRVCASRPEGEDDSPGR